MREPPATRGDGAQTNGAAQAKAHQQFLRFLDTLPAAAYTCDAAGLLTFYNARAARLWGREPRLNDPAERWSGALGLYLPDGTPLPHASNGMALAVQQDRELTGQEILVERPDGERVAVLAHASPLRDEGGRLVGAVNVLTEVGPYHESEALQARLAAIVQCSDDAIISKSLDGTIETWNPGAERLFGYTAEEIIGKPIYTIVPPERHEEERQILATLTRGGRIDHLETVRVAKSGQRIFVSVTTSPVRDGAGRIIGASKVARDITLRKQSELALAALAEQRAHALADMARLREMGSRLWTEQELRPILEESLRTAVAIQDTDMGVISMWDPDGGQLVLGASVGFAPEILAAIERVPAGQGASGLCCLGENRVIVEDVEADPRFEAWRETARAAGVRAVHSTPLKTRGGELVGVLTTHFRHRHRPSQREMELVDLCAIQAVDFIENAQLQASLRDADVRKNQFLATLAHELRNPLAPVRNAVELLRRSPADPPTLERTLAVLERQVNHMVRLIDDLMDVSRITLGRFPLKKETTTLAAVLEMALETCRPALEAAGHHLRVTQPPEPVTLKADPVRLAQVFANLVGNAIKYTPDHGHIEVAVSRVGADRVAVDVRDDGLGIPPQALATIFDAFTQVGGVMERSQGGLGIGLSLVRGLVELHGGTIRAASAGVGEGSVFTVELPTLPGAAALPAEPADAGAPAADEPARVLVVDDNEDAAWSFGLLVRRLGHEVRVARDGIEAVQAAAEFRPHVVFLDIGLPRLSGHEVARAIRGQSWGRDVFLVALTGWGQDEDKRRAAESGFDLHLIKPIDPSSVADLIRGSRHPRR